MTEGGSMRVRVEGVGEGCGWALQGVNAGYGVAVWVETVDGVDKVSMEIENGRRGRKCEWRGG